MRPVFRENYGIQSEISHSEELKIIDVTDDQRGRLHNVQKEHVEKWLDNYLIRYSEGVEEQETEDSRLVSIV